MPEIRKIKTDVLIIGGGTAGCYAAAKLGEETDLKIVIAEKANIERSGCLAAGVNALNAYISKGHVPEDYVAYAKKDGEGIVRDDLLLSMSRRFNEVTADLEKRGLVILKDENGEYVTRGWRNIKINGENIKPILAKAARDQKNVTVLNHVNVTDLKVITDKIYRGDDRNAGKADQSGHPGTAGTDERSGRRVTGAIGFSVRENVFYDFIARAVLIATGGASGLYRPNNPGFSRHKMWYPPFNTGAGYAMGFLAGAEMTTFENRFVALRCKDTIAPTGTIAQGVHARQVNSKGEIYENKYGLTTPERIYGTVEENRAGNGPCYLDTVGISKEAEQDLYKAYLNMAPSQTLKWIEAGKGPSEQGVEVEGTEPYVVGGHTASGFWVDTDRQTTVSGLFAAGDVAGGAPQKYVTGALAEGEIAAESIAAYVGSDGRRIGEARKKEAPESAENVATDETGRKFREYESHLEAPEGILSIQNVEEAMQKVMDEYAGGIRTDYRYNESRLQLADEKIRKLEELVKTLHASDMFDLLHIYEIRERLVVCRILIAHLRARKETRWHIFGENADYPEKSEAGGRYVNSYLENGKIQIVFRDLVRSEEYHFPKEK